MKRIVNILWTGGLDSTCRIAELSKFDVLVQPYYVIDYTRGSIKEELNAIKDISEIIRKNSETRCELRDIITIKLESIKEDKEITDAWLVFKNKYQLGSQYDYLARLAKQEGLILEVGLESSSRSKATNAVKGECELVLTDLDGISEYQIDKEQSSALAILLFENLRLPSSLWNMTKLEEIEEMKRLHLDEIILKTWFCHTPIFGMPCGHCHPCQDALNEGLSFRVPITGFILGGIRWYSKWVYYHILVLFSHLK